MGFFNSDFLARRRLEWKNAITKFQYQVDKVWYDAVINSSGIEGNKLVFSVVIPDNPSTAHIVAAIRLLDTNENEAALQTLKIERSAGQSLLASFEFPIQEV